MKPISILNWLTITAILSFAINAHAQTNSWTKTTSGDWHEAFWSLGVLPGPDQDHIMFTNAGWKALAINRVTSRDFPDSLNIPRLTVASPTNTVNTLLLNFAGVQAPLRVADFLNLGSNAFLVTLSSGIEVGQNLLIDGTVNHGDLSEVSASSLYVGDTAPGVYNFSNGVVSAGNVIVGDGTTGSFEQSGGRLSVSGRLTVGQGDRRTFAQGNGRFELMAGTLTAPTLQIGEVPLRLGPSGADGTFIQTGGSNVAGRLLLGGPESDLTAGRNYTYILNDGLLMTSNTVVYGGNGNFAQGGGLHRVDGPLALGGFYGRSFSLFDAQYTLSGGVVTARSLSVDFGTMAQSAGTNRISGDVVIGRKEALSRRSFYDLSGGHLSTSNTVVFDSEYGGFSQSGGTHFVDNLLEIAGDPHGFGPSYALSAGGLGAGSIQVRSNAVLQQSGGSIQARRINIDSGEHNFSNGHVNTENLYIGNGATGSVHQLNGTLWVTERLLLGTGDARNSLQGSGIFKLADGRIRTPLIQLGTVSGYPGSPGGEGFFEQSGGTNTTARVIVGTPDSFDRNENTYVLNAGVLVPYMNTIIHADSRFVQSGGIHSPGALIVRGNIARSTPRPATYVLSNGLVRSGSLDVEVASVMQFGGTNAISGNLRVIESLPTAHSEYILSAGTLTTLNTIVSPSQLDAFVQRGGTHTIEGALDLPAMAFARDPNITSVSYRLESGLLDVGDIRIGSNSTFAHVSGSISHRGTLVLAGGRWQSAMGQHQLGTLKLNGAGTNSSLSLGDNATTLRFATSSGIPWEPAGALDIHNWRGSTNGGGSHRVIFGTDQTGLTSQQLAQIRFRNPLGLASGDYTATILNTGEIIPLEPTGRGPAISFQRSPGQLRMEWPAGYMLQTATNILGPFEDLNVSSPHNIDTTADPMRFFRLQQSETP